MTRAVALNTPAIYRKSSKRLREWLTANKAKRWPARDLDDDLAQAASLLEAAAQMAEIIEKGMKK
jgi:hypothetical protein